MLWLIREPIDVEMIRSSAMDPGAGAVVVFEGRVRNHHEGKKVKGLQYEAYPALTLKVFERLEAEARDRWPLSSVDIVHRVGPLQIGEAAVVVAVASAHRREAFEACSFLVEELKKNAPIWKKEFYEDGTSAWVGCAAEHRETTGDGSVAGRRAEPPVRQ